MDAPLCPICNTKHYGAEHVFKADVAQTVRAPGTPATSRNAPGVAGSSPAAAATFDRRAYQRAYMRSYRKKQSLMLQTAKALLDHVAEPWPRG